MVRSTTLFTIMALGLMACTHPSTNTYSSKDVGQVIETTEGVVLSSRTVEITGGEEAGIGTLAGAGTGAVVAGSTIGQGSGSVVAAVIGGLIGAGAGYIAEKEIRSRDGIEYVIRLRDGRVVTLVQNREKEEPPLADGSAVLVQYGGNYTRVIPNPTDAGAPAGSWQNPDEAAPAPTTGAPSASGTVVPQPLPPPGGDQQD